MSERAARLVHDVAKYVARIARNVPEKGPFPPELRPMLLKDLYELPTGQRASRRFAELVEPGELAEVAGWLHAIDELEPKLREGDLTACLRACRLARQVEAALRAHAEGPA